MTENVNVLYCIKCRTIRLKPLSIYHVRLVLICTVDELEIMSVSVNVLFPSESLVFCVHLPGQHPVQEMSPKI